MKAAILSPSIRATMAPRVTARKTTRQSLKLPNEGHSSIPAFHNKTLTGAGKQPQGIKKHHQANPPRRSARLNHSIKVDKTLAGIRQKPFPSPVSDIKSVGVRYPFGLLIEYSLNVVHT